MAQLRFLKQHITEITIGFSHIQTRNSRVEGKLAYYMTTTKAQEKPTFKIWANPG